jgi:hypothetical protein
MLACWLGAIALAAAAVAQDVEIALVRMGVGSHARPGDLTGILVRVTSGLQAPVQARIEWSLRNADGDVARYSADAALAPGAPVERWIYGVPPILTASAQGSLEAVSALRVVEVADGRVVRVLGEQRIDGQSGEEPVVPVETTESLIGVVGDGRAGLSAFATPTPNMGTIASMNELTRIARGIRPSQLPDRWEGLASFDSVIWTNAPVQNLGIEQARALLDWTRRGGNLVIVLPESGDPWGLGAGRRGTPLAEALPERATRTDAVPVRTLMPVLARTGTLRNEAARTALWTFPPDAGNGFTPLALLPGQVDERSGNLVTEEGSLDGQAFAVRRPFGFGFVTVIGIDVDGLDRRALVAEGLPQADIFWNRILGRRADAPTMSEYDQLAKDKRLETRGGLVVTADGGALVNHFVGMQSRAAIGVLGLLLAFVIYWAVAGPVSWWSLRGAGRVQYAWLAYVGVAAAVTAVAWAATGLFEFTSGRVQHLTFIDRVERPGAPAEERAAMRAQSWFSAALPGYGSSRVAVARTDGAAGGNVLWSWFPPPAGSMGGFPDTETYDVPASSQAAYDLPSRATSTVLAAAWMGTPDPAWDGTPREMDGRRLRCDVTWGNSPRVILHGALSHSLPAALVDVTLVHVNPFHPASRRTDSVKGDPTIVPSGMPPSYARMARLARWEPRAPLDVARALYADDRDGPEGDRPPVALAARDSGIASTVGTMRARYRDPITQSALSMIDPSEVLPRESRLEAIQLYGMLDPPQYLLSGQQAAQAWRGEAVRIERDFGRWLDLGRWWSQPCLLVVGRLEDPGDPRIGMPFPFTIDGDAPAADGNTWVRVAFPLAAVPGAMLPPRQ